jgi:hypothetical protein
MAWKNKKQNDGKSASEPQLKVPPFWCTCKCGAKVACPLDWVLKYLDRIGWEAGPKEEA